VDALTALFLLQASRLPARAGALSLEEQDRRLWNRTLIAEGMHYLEQSLVPGAAMTRYHCEAAIAAEHAIAPSFEATNWPLIVEHYDDLLAIAPGPAVELNRSIAIGFRDGPAAALVLLDELATEPQLERHYLLYAAQADFRRRAGDYERAMAAWRIALQFAPGEPARAVISRRMAELSGPAPWLLTVKTSRRGDR
jgi:RNA polymerase sigma-70 factor (ECF subfamily)